MPEDRIRENLKEMSEGEREEMRAKERFERGGKGSRQAERTHIRATEGCGAQTQQWEAATPPP